MSEFRYRCAHGVGLHDNCAACHITLNRADGDHLKSEERRMQSPTYREVLSRHKFRQSCRDMGMPWLESWADTLTPISRADDAVWKKTP